MDVTEPTDGTRRHSGAETYRVRYDPDGELELSELIVMAVADASDTDPLDMDPLYDAVDPETVNDFVDRGGSAGFDGSVTFAFEGYEVTVEASGLVDLVRSDA
ncbi:MULTISPECIES: HalOD1 output domain-containing protein [Halorussus]|uniref:HalOD1 output domain-containing protein n=1 Tax=Halorussus TaxID=1070314 RepID=UPI0020A07C3C|nr:HalOD1 output domain-containing protein [Halorussus vallis]USZ78034.1 hypothetical protein NGM07_20440 [Halorussus vallis]